MLDKYVMILGAGLMQRPAIEAAHELGYKVFLVDANPKAICVPLADIFSPIDLKDREGLLSSAKNFPHKICAVFTAGTDFSASVAFVAENLKLPSHSFKSALNASDKILMRTCFQKNNVPSPAFVECKDSKLLQNVHFPKVIKPVDNMGARGCRLIRDASEYQSSVEVALSASRSKTAILEDYMDGLEFSIDALIYKGTFTVTGFADRHIFYPPYFIEMGHTMPSNIEENIKFDLIKTFASGAKALGLTHGVAKADIKYTKNGAMIGEIAARLSGGYMSGWTFPFSANFNLTKEALNLALGTESENFLKMRKKLSFQDSECGFELYELPSIFTSAERAWISIPGIVSDVIGLESAEKIPFIKNVFPRVQTGDFVDFPRNNVEKCGNCISLAPTRKEAIFASEKAVSSIVIRLKANNSKTDDFLFGKQNASEKGFPENAFTLPENLQSEIDNYFKIKSSFVFDAPILNQIPKEILNRLSDFSDWNHRTILESIQIIDKLVLKHKDWECKKIWTLLMRGGVQAVLYFADTEKEA